MSIVLFCHAVVSALSGVYCALWLWWGQRSVVALREVDAAAGGEGPRVSVIVAARNEGADIEEAMRSLIAQDWADLEIVAVDDRSTDDTGEILDRLAAGEERLRVIHVAELPDGWLGKNHALYRGAAEAGGELLLFADADVVMAPSAVRRAVAYMTAGGIDHLAVMPALRLPGAALKAFVIVFAQYFTAFVRPWKVKDPRSKAHVGVGAFNLVRAEAYAAAGTHKAIAMRPDDDLKLGKIVKAAGFRQDLADGKGLLRLRWYASLGELIDGLMKNQFAAFGYRPAAVVVATVLMLAQHVWPFVAVWVTPEATAWLYGVAALAVLSSSWRTARLLGVSGWYAAGAPAAVVAHAYVIWRSMLLTLLRGGIRWRDTHYPLAKLRENKV